MDGIVNCIWRTPLLGDTFAFMPALKAYAIKHNVVLNMIGHNSFLALFPQESWWKRGVAVPGARTITMEVGDIHRKIGLHLGCLYTIDVSSAHRIDMSIPGQKVFDSYVVIAPSASTTIKELQDPMVWQKVIDAIPETVIVVGEREKLWNNCHYVNCDTPQKLLNIIGHADLVVGLSSGISWLADACNRDIIRINGFSDGDREFTPLFQMQKNYGCRQCWNKGATSLQCSSMACMDFTAYEILQVIERWRMMKGAVPCHVHHEENEFLRKWANDIDQRYHCVCGIDELHTDLAMITRANRDMGKSWKYDQFDMLLI